MSITDEARAKAYECNPVSYRAGYAAGQASRKVEVIDDKRQAVAAILVSNGIKPHDPAYYHLIDDLAAALGEGKRK